MTKFRSQMFVIGDLVKPNFNSTEVYGLGLVVDVDDSSMNPKVSVLWSHKHKPMDEYFQDIIRVETD
jgi:hypothetical protein